VLQRSVERASLFVEGLELVLQILEVPAREHGVERVDDLLRGEIEADTARCGVQQGGDCMSAEDFTPLTNAGERSLRGLDVRGEACL
jgi:hypothetical protein